MICPEESRLTSKEVLNHPFIKEVHTRESNIDIEKNMESKMKNLKEYSESSLVKKIVISTLVQRLSFEEIEDLQSIFNEMDVDNDGVISKEEFCNGLKNSNYFKSNNEIDKLFKMIDTDNSKKINFSEFIAATVDKKFFDSKEKLLEVFQNFDRDNNGKISFDEFQKVLNMEGIDNNAFADLKKEFAAADYNGDGFIEYDEFVRYIVDRKDRITKKSNGW